MAESRMRPVTSHGSGPVPDRGRAARRPPRWTDSPLPEHPYLPGKAPHPHRSPDGRAIARELLRAERLGPQSWHEDHAWLHGVDLWNAGYFWEAHEAWETAWNARGRAGDQANFLRALIQAAAVHVKIAVREPAAVAALWARACTGLQPWSSVESCCYMGLDVGDFVARQGAWVDAWLEGRSEGRAGSVPEFPFLVLADAPSRSITDPVAT